MEHRPIGILSSTRFIRQTSKPREATEELRRLFEEYAQGVQSICIDIGNSTLGLAIVMRNGETHCGGRLSLSGQVANCSGNNYLGVRLLSYGRYALESITKAIQEKCYNEFDEWLDNSDWNDYQWPPVAIVSGGNGGVRLQKPFNNERHLADRAYTPRQFLYEFTRHLAGHVGQLHEAHSPLSLGYQSRGESNTCVISQCKSMLLCSAADDMTRRLHHVGSLYTCISSVPCVAATDFPSAGKGFTPPSMPIVSLRRFWRAFAVSTLNVSDLCYFYEYERCLTYHTNVVEAASLSFCWGDGTKVLEKRHA